MPTEPRRPRSATVLFAAALLLFVVGSVVAWWQPPRLFPLKPQTAAEWWLQPLEDNAFQRMPRIAENLTDVFVVPTTGGEVWAVGGSTWHDFIRPKVAEDKRDGLIVHSRDGGITWERILVKPGPDKAQQRLPGLDAIVFIADGQRGWIAGLAGTILATDDGGNTWQNQVSDTTERIHRITFAADGLHGWAVGTNGMITSTDNGGKTWKAQTISEHEDLHGIAFTADTQRGWAVGTRGTILASTDGGKTWNHQTSLSEDDLFGVAFTADGLHGWAVGGNGTILASADGGKTWNRQTSLSEGELFGVAFAADGLRGWAVGGHGKILASADGGKTWNPQTSPSKEELYGVALTADGLRGWAVGQDGTILASADGGKTWHPPTSNSTKFLSDVAFAADGSRGWAVGGDGTILASSDYGKTWNLQISTSKGTLSGVAFAADGSRGWAVGTFRQILASADGGKTWYPQIRPSRDDLAEDLSDVAFSADGLRGWAVGWYGSILATVDGGKTWKRQTIASTVLTSVAFTADGLRGWAVGWGGTILASADGGRTWNQQTSPSTANLYDVTLAADGLRGWAVGEDGTILASADAGRTWNQQTSPSTADLFGVTFAAEGLHGWAVGSNGTILASNNGGVTWEVQASGTDANLADIAFAADAQHGLAVGNNLTLLTTSNGGKTWSPVEYHRYPAPWYFLVCLSSLILAAIGTRRPQPQTLTASVADLLASDRPLDNPAADALGYADIAAGLSRFLRNPQTLPPLTVAITGEWGSGKSSLMNLLKADLKKAGFRTVWFNAWHHQKGEQLLASLFANLRAQAIPPWFSRAGWSFRWKLLYRRSLRHAVLLVVLLVLLSLSLGYLLKDFAHVWQLLTAGDWATLNKDNLGALSPLLGSLAVLLTGLVALYNGMKGFGLDPAKLMASVSAGGGKLKPLEPGARYQFAEEFADVTEALAPGRLVIFIDDLDRCSKENVLEVLESVNFLVSSGGCFVVLGMAREWVETCVGLNFKELAEEHNHGDDDKAYRTEFARKYLQKLINIEVPVPKLDAGDSLRLMPEALEVPEPGNRLAAGWSAVWAWLFEARQALFIGLLLLGGGLLGYWQAQSIGGGLDGLHGAAEQPKPVDIALPAGLDVKLTGADGGLVVDLASSLKNETGQWLLRADPAELDKGVVLGKLGAAELVLKRPVVAEPPFVGPVKPVVEPPKPAEEKPKSAENTGPSFTPGATDDGHSPWHIGPPALTGLVLLGFGLVLLLRSPVKLTEDSDKFMQALKTWHPLIAASCPTPRMVKRYLNWVRFLAMRYRPAEAEAAGIWTRLSRRFGFAAKPGQAAAEAEKVFDEDILVALSAIYQYRREWVLDFKKFEQIANNGFVQLLRDEQNRQKENWDALPVKVYNALSSFNQQDWQKAAEQRERFIEAIGDVDVA